MNIESIGKRCSGCGVCAALCPKQCIRMENDGEGFRVPRADAQQCVDCGLCLKRCPINNTAHEETHTVPAAYAAYAKNAELLLQSSSGGLFTVIAQAILSQGGRVYGTVMNDQDEAVVQGTDSEAGLTAMRGSKYVQSSISHAVYQEIKDTLDQNRKVLFTGCPCQVAAVKAYLGEDRENLFTADIICHGVPSPLLYRTYLRYLEARKGGKVSAYHCRDKSKGWGRRFSYTVKGRTILGYSAFDPYQNHFTKGNLNRESCYHCPFASPRRAGDVTLGDYWGILKEHPSFYNPNGVSLLTVNTEKGRLLFDGIKGRLECLESTYAKASAHNENLLHPCVRSGIRDTIYAGINELPPAAFIQQNLKVSNSMKSVVKELMPASWKAKCKNLIRRIIK